MENKFDEKFAKAVAKVLKNEGGMSTIRRILEAKRSMESLKDPIRIWILAHTRWC